MAEPQGNVRRRWTQSVVLTGATPVVVKAVKNATSKILVSKVTLSILTHAAETFLALDATPFIICSHLDVTPQAAGVLSTVTWDFGEDGVELNLGQPFAAQTGATMTGIVYAEGWEVYTV